MVVLGEREVATRLVRIMAGDREQGFKPVAVFCSEPAEGMEGTAPEDVPYLGDLENAPIFAHASRITTAILRYSLGRRICKDGTAPAGGPASDTLRKIG